MSFRVLIADDQLVVRSILRLAVGADERLEVCKLDAQTGREAIDLARSQTPEAVILDCEMPEMDGLEALPPIRAALPDGIIVMYSSKTSPETATAALSAGADAFIAKGDQTPMQVVALVADALCDREG